MISFGPTEEQAIARDAMREFAAQAMRPIARESDEASKIPEEFLAQSWELGLVSTQLPEAYGGGGAPRSPVMTASRSSLRFSSPAGSMSLLQPGSSQRRPARSHAGEREEIANLGFIVSGAQIFAGI